MTTQGVIFRLILLVVMIAMFGAAVGIALVRYRRTGNRSFLNLAVMMVGVAIVSGIAAWLTMGTLSE